MAFRAQLNLSSRFLAVALALLAVMPVMPVAAAADNSDEPILKPDVPKLDLTVPPSKRTLKGGVQHIESALPAKKKLSAAASGTGFTGKLKNDGKLSSGTAKMGIFDKLFKVKTAQQNPLNANVQNGIGIIGVKFILGFGRPPTINRVFSGTPAHESGLRVDDIIVAVDGVPTNGLTKDEVYGMIVGRPDTPVTLSVLRNGDFMARTMQRMDFNDIADPLVKRDYMMSL